MRTLCATATLSAGAIILYCYRSTVCGQYTRTRIIIIPIQASAPRSQPDTRHGSAVKCQHCTLYLVYEPTTPIYHSTTTIIIIIV